MIAATYSAQSCVALDVNLLVSFSPPLEISFPLLPLQATNCALIHRRLAIVQVLVEAE
jgi:hypothetical protein